MTTPPKRRWFRFSIRDLLWLTVVAALATGWWIDHLRIERFGQKAAAVQKKNDLLEADRKSTDYDLQRLSKENRTLKQQYADSIK